MHSDNYTVPFILAILNLPYTTPLPQVFHWFLFFLFTISLLHVLDFEN